MPEEYLEVGDTLVTKTFMGSIHFTITRVTKTLAKSKRKDGYEYTFKRRISNHMSYPSQAYDPTTYYVIKGANHDNISRD